jgi:hypothetical protein
MVGMGEMPYLAVAGSLFIPFDLHQSLLRLTNAPRRSSKLLCASEYYFFQLRSALPTSDAVCLLEC